MSTTENIFGMVLITCILLQLLLLIWDMYDLHHEPVESAQARQFRAIDRLGRSIQKMQGTIGVDDMDDAGSVLSAGTIRGNSWYNTALGFFSTKWDNVQTPDPELLLLAAETESIILGDPLDDPPP